MTHATTILYSGVQGNKRMVTAKIDITSYTASGEVITPAELGLASVDNGLIDPHENAQVARFDEAAMKVRLYVPNTGAELAGTTDAGEVLLQVFGN